MQTMTRVKVAALAATLVFGMIAAFSMVAPSPASAQSLHIELFNITVTRAPHVITITDNGTNCLIVLPVTNCHADVFGGAVPTALVLFNISLFTLDSHLAVSSIITHLPDANNPNCLFTLQGNKLVNLNALNLLLVLLAQLGAYSVANCGLLVTAAIGLALGASPSTAHLHAHLEVVHV